MDAASAQQRLEARRCAPFWSQEDAITPEQAVAYALAETPALDPRR